MSATLACNDWLVSCWLALRGLLWKEVIWQRDRKHQLQNGGSNYEVDSAAEEAEVEVPDDIDNKISGGHSA